MTQERRFLFALILMLCIVSVDVTHASKSSCNIENNYVSKIINVPSVSKQYKETLRQTHLGKPLVAVNQSFTSQKSSEVEWKPLDGDTFLSNLLISNKDQETLYFTVQIHKTEKEGTFRIKNGEDWSTISHDAFNNEGKIVLGPYSASEILVEQVMDGVTQDDLGKGPTLENLYIDFVASSSKRETGFGTSHECNPNTICPDADPYRDQVSGVTRVILVLEEGIGFCSGSLVNNTSNDFTPYVLGAFHCQNGYTPLFDMWRFDFFYESETCENPTDEPAFQSLTGCDMVAGRLESDFLLLELHNDIPAQWAVHFNGWNRTPNYHPEPAVMIHHPSGDIKKISEETDELWILQSGIVWDSLIRTPEEHHFSSILDIGTQEPGSSGSPLFDVDGLIIGQLHGGGTEEGECNQIRAYFGRIEKSWAEGDTPASRLRDWLDPLGTNQMTVDGILYETNVSYSLSVMTSSGDPLANAMVRLSGDLTDQYMTNESGVITISDIPANAVFDISLSKNDDQYNGLSAIDLVLTRKHILGLDVFENEIQILAADANNNGSVSVADIVHVQNVILGLWDELPAREAWGFLPETVSINPEEGVNTEINITAFKIGDVNFSADPE